ncbi:MAG: ABC transporter substrate-binding protein [Cyanobacteria bacterium J06621_11]
MKVSTNVPPINTQSISMLSVLSDRNNNSRKICLFSLLLSGLALGTLACSPPSSDATQSSDVSALPSEADTAQRIVTLTSLSADLVVTLDATKLVGIPGSPLIISDSRFAEIETVSAGRGEPDLEKIIALSPDLVIGAEGIQDKALERLSELDIQTSTVSIDSWKDLSAFTTTLAETMAADPQPLLDRYDACLADIPEKQTSSLVLVSRQPLLSPNQNSWAGDFLAKMNIQNLAADLQGESPFEGYVTLSAEKVIEADPDSLIVVDTQENLLEELKGQPFWSQLQATQSEKVFTTDYFGLVNPGSVASIEAACALLKQME